MTPRSRLSRQTLFDLVWAQPMTKVAARLGISDVALKKICLKHHVPVPGRGYWAKVAVGKHVKGAALASTGDPMLEEVEIYGSQLLLRPNVWRAKREATGDDQASERKITVSPVTGLLHPTVALTVKSLRKKRPNEFGLVTAREPECLPVSVTPAAINRAAAILSALVCAAQERGYTTEAAKDGAGLRINGERIGFRLRERVERQPHQRTPQEVARAERAARLRRGAHEFQFRSWEPEWDYVPSGKFTWNSRTSTTPGFGEDGPTAKGNG